MNVEHVLYWIDILSSAKMACAVFCICLVLIIPISFIIHSSIIHSSVDEEDEKKVMTAIILSSLLLVVSIFGCIFIPSEKTMYAIAFARYSRQSDIPQKVLKAIETKLDEVISGG